MKKKILLYDIETSPLISYTWGMYQQDVIKVIRESEVLSVSYKWLGESKIYFMRHPNYRKSTDKKIIKKLHRLFDEADIIIAHNGDKFDQKKSNARMLLHELDPPSPYRTVDTLKVAKKYFKLSSNRLDALAQYLGIGCKTSHQGFKLWEGCMDNDERSWALMERYNKQDVRLLEKVYLRLRTWIERHPPVSNRPNACWNCGHSRWLNKGWEETNTRKYLRLKCCNCGKYHHNRTSEPGAIRNIKG